MKKPEVIVGGYDRITWLNEKSDNVIRHLSQVFDLINNATFNEEEKELIISELHYVMKDSLNVFLCLQGHPNGYQPDEYVDSKEKYLQLMENYNLYTFEMSKRNKVESDSENYKKIYSLLDIKVNHNRSEVNRILDKIFIKDHLYFSFNELLNDCNMGIIDWKYFCEEAEKLIKFNMEI